MDQEGYVYNTQKTIFVGGPISNLVSCESASKWLQEFILAVTKEFESHGWIVRSAHIAESFGLRVPSPKTIVCRDLEWVSRSDFAIFILPVDTNRQPIRTEGTCIEIGFAVCARIPIVILVENLAAHSPMLHGLEALPDGVTIINLDTGTRDCSDIISRIKAVIEHHSSNQSNDQ